jgi:hypothetical protein
VAKSLTQRPALPWTPRLYQPGDEAEIMALFRRVFGLDLGLEYWRWKFAAIGLGMHVALGVTPTGEVIGQMAGLPLRVQAEGRSLVASCIVDVMIAPEYRQGLRKPGVFPTLFELLVRSVAGDDGAALTDSSAGVTRSPSPASSERRASCRAAAAAPRSGATCSARSTASGRGWTGSGPSASRPSRSRRFVTLRS